MGRQDRYVSHPRAVRGGAQVLYGNSAMEAGAFSVGNPAHINLLDLACGMPLGWNGEPPLTPRASSFDETCDLLWSGSFDRGPCHIPFSGGRESSMWLATATRHARRHGHDDPIPLTLRHPGLASAEELEFQERIVAHLGLADWKRIEVDDLDLVGSVARETLSLTGPLWPPNAYLMAPLVEAAHAGVFVFITGLSDFFAWWRWAPLVALLDGTRRYPGKRDLALLASVLVPASMRARAAARRGTPPPMPWLRPEAARDAFALLRLRHADVPLRFDRAMGSQVTHRCFDGAAGTLDALGRSLDTPVEQPLRRAGVVESLAGSGGGRGFRSLTAMLRAMCGELLPAELLAARRGPDLNPVFFGEASREFAAELTGDGLAESIVDVEVLRRNWLSDRPDPRTACLLQYAWLTERGAVAGSQPTARELLLAHSNPRETP
jgi:hypothetical protein